MNRARSERETINSSTMGTASGKKMIKKESRLVGMQRKHLGDPEREIFEAAESGDAVLLREVLQEMNRSERTSALETKMAVSLRWGEDEYETFRVTPLTVAAKNGNADCVKVLLNYEADIECRVDDDEWPWTSSLTDLLRGLGEPTPLFKRDVGIDLDRKDSCRGYTPLFFAATHGHLDVLSRLVENGADVNTRSIYNCTPLMIASRYGLEQVVTFLVEHGANMDLQDKRGRTALHFAVDSCDVLSCLIRNGADVNACTNDNCTPLMIASLNGHMNAVCFLVEHGANMDLQDKHGDTALHYAVNGNLSKVAHKLLSLGASQLYNNKGLTALLSASNKHKISVVEDLITRPEYTKKQRIDALELLGASLATVLNSEGGFEYIKRGMEERFADPSHPLFKQSMEPLEAYQNRKESQTLEELAQIEGDRFAIIMESLIIRERILGTNNAELLGPIRSAANSYFIGGSVLCIQLSRHAIKIAQNCSQSAVCDLHDLTVFLCVKVWSVDPPSQKDILELLEETVLEYEKQQKLRREPESKSIEFRVEQYQLFDSTEILLKTIAKFKLYEEGQSPCLSVLLQKLFPVDPDGYGDSLLHKLVKVCHRIDELSPLKIEVVKLLLNVGFNVNVVNDSGETPLHRAVTFKPSSDKIHLLTDMLEVLLDGGAHHDFVNNDGKTAMDMAETDEARMILSEKNKLELKCISARAVKTFGLPYLGHVPKTLEKFISMH